MTSSLTTARNAIQSEVKQLKADLAKLEKILAQLGDAPSDSTRRETGKRKYTRRQPAGAQDVSAALKLIESAGKGGIKAIKLAHEINKAGGGKPSKTDLLSTEKVKMTGKGGGSTYVYIG